MFKKTLLGAAVMLLSLNASAGYLQFQLTGPIQGHLIQHEDSGSIADYSMFAVVPFPGMGRAGFQIYPFFGEGGLTSTYGFAGGPTSFVNYNRSNETSESFFRVGFAPTNKQGWFAYTADYEVGLWNVDGWRYASGTVKGLALQQIVPEWTEYVLDLNGGYGDGVSPTFPSLGGSGGEVFLPEPSNIALLSIALLGALGAARRRT